MGLVRYVSGSHPKPPQIAGVLVCVGGRGCGHMRTVHLGGGETVLLAARETPVKPADRPRGEKRILAYDCVASG